jgi:hypothetical protein
MVYNKPDPRVWTLNEDDGMFYRTKEDCLRIIYKLEKNIEYRKSKKMRPRNVRQVRKMRYKIMELEGYILEQV